MARPQIGDLLLGSAYANLLNRAAYIKELGYAVKADLEVVSNLRSAIKNADIVSTATRASEPIIKGNWIQHGTQVDLIGSYTPDIREADDALISNSSMFVDYRETIINCVGDLTQAIANGVITAADVRDDLYDLVNASVQGRENNSQITVFKNGGDAHLDLMVADYVANVVKLDTHKETK